MAVKTVAPIIYGTNILRKLIPPVKMAMISVLKAILEVKKITEIKVNKGENMFTKKGMKLK
jgi:hypothetical protein